MSDDLLKLLDVMSELDREYGFSGRADEIDEAAAEIRRLRAEVEGVKRRRDAAMDDRDAEEARAEVLAEKLEIAKQGLSQVIAIDQRRGVMDQWDGRCATVARAALGRISGEGE